ncbi:hypothetical protein HC031_12485, partial [Planosporangium thailandense]
MLLSRTAAGATLFVAAASGVLVSTPASAGTRPPDPGVATAAPDPAAPQARCRQRGILQGSHYSAVQIARVARDAGFRGHNWTVSVAVALGESGGWSRGPHVKPKCR